MDLTPIQQNFAAGELGRRMGMRMDLSAWTAGVEEMRNMVPLSQGPTTRRPGTLNRLNLNNGTNSGRLFPFPIDSNTGFVVAMFGRGKGAKSIFLFYDVSGKSFVGGLINNPNFVNGKSYWNLSIGADSNIEMYDSRCLISFAKKSTVGASSYIAQQFTEGTSPKLRVRIRTSLIGKNVVVYVRAGISDNDFSLGEWKFTGTEFNADFDATGIPGSSVTITVGIALSDQNENVRTDLLEHRLIREFSLVEVIQIDKHRQSLQLTGRTYSTGELETLQIDISPTGKQMFIASKTVEPSVITYVGGTILFKIENLSATSGANLPDEWVSGNYPGTVFFFEGRSYFGGTPNEPNEFWGSASGIYNDLKQAPGIPPEDKPSAPFRYSVKRYQRIHWMTGLRNMMIGTDMGEFVAKSRDNDPMYDGNTNVNMQSQHGSRRRQPVLIGNNILFASQDGRKLRDTGYKWTEETWVTRDLTYVSDDITEDDRLISEVHWAPNPDNLLFCPTDNGELLIAAYEWNNNIIGWSRSNTDGDVNSACVIEHSGMSKVFLMVKRDDGLMCLEEMTRDIYLDNATVRHIGGENIVDDLGYLGKAPIGILTDGAVHPDASVSGTGKVHLNWEAKTVIAGLKYESHIKTVPLDMAVSTGSASSSMKRRNKIYVRIDNSALPLVNGERPSERNPSTPMNTAEPFITGDLVVVNLGRDQYAQVTIAQNVPYPLTVLGIYGEAAVERI